MVQMRKTLVNQAFNFKVILNPRKFLIVNLTNKGNAVFLDNLVERISAAEQVKQLNEALNSHRKKINEKARRAKQFVMPKPSLPKVMTVLMTSNQ